MMIIAREGMQLAAFGAVLGIVMAVAVGRILALALIGVPPTDAVTFVSAVMLAWATTLLACCVPAYRVTRIPATEVLRTE
jgi:ABC-type antimicrobial peptide transport system permease subunit